MVTATPPKKQPAQNVRVIGKDTTNKTPFERRKEGVTGILQMIATPMAFVPSLLPDAAVIARYESRGYSTGSPQWDRTPDCADWSSQWAHRSRQTTV